MKLFFEIKENETLINLTYIVIFFAQQMLLCFINNSFNDENINVMTQPYYQIYYVYLC